MLFAPQIPYSAAGLLFSVKFAAARAGRLAHAMSAVRGPISFARLRHVLVFAVAAAGVDAGLRVHRASASRGDRTARPAPFWLSRAELVDRRLPRARWSSRRCC